MTQKEKRMLELFREIERIGGAAISDYVIDYLVAVVTTCRKRKAKRTQTVCSTKQKLQQKREGQIVQFIMPGCVGSTNRAEECNQ